MPSLLLANIYSQPSSDGFPEGLLDQPFTAGEEELKQAARFNVLHRAALALLKR